MKIGTTPLSFTSRGSWWALALAGFVSLAGSAPATLEAATITVTSTADSGPGSLRAALKNSRGGDTMRFSLPSPAIITLTSGELLVAKNLSILGPGAGNLTVSGNHVSRVFRIASRMTVTIAGLTISQGFTTASGGGIFSDHATLTVSNCVVTGNATAAGHGTGGGLCSDGSLRGDAALTVVNSLVSGNSAGNSGGGIMNDGNGNSSGTVTATVQDSILNGNSTELYGGGICSIGAAKLNVIHSTLSGNATTYPGSFSMGGGLYNGGGATVVSVLNCTLNHNSASHAGGVLNAIGTLTIANCTLSANSAMQGGGILNNGGAVTLLNSTLSGNADEFAGIVSVGNLPTLTIGSSILENVSPGEIAGGTVTSLGYNLCRDAGSGVLTQSTDQINTDPQLGPLQDNGGPTWTHAPAPTSPAVDRGYNFSGSATDQRGGARTVDYSAVPNAAAGDGTDIGAVEVQ